jgi:hypothetical protein
MMVEEKNRRKEFIEALGQEQNQKIRGFKRSSCRSSKKNKSRETLMDYMPQAYFGHYKYYSDEFKCLVKP